ncbi:MAG TPA: DUF2267 domain-containing protein [Gemmatimonadales bacterium]|nr:DUF2267 domain-containing protein [Gemmatimonadales bacterium]
MTSTPNPEPRAGAAQDVAGQFFSHIALTGALVRDVTPQAAASAVLCVLSQRVSGGEAVQLRDALPGSLRELVSPCPRDRHDPPHKFDRHEFLHRIARRLHIEDYEAEPVARAVFHALQEDIPAVRREIDDVEKQLPNDLKELWRIGHIH